MTVDDGSGPEEAKKMESLVSDLQNSYDFLLDPLLVQKNQGKGGAIYSDGHGRCKRLQMGCFC